MSKGNTVWLFVVVVLLLSAIALFYPSGVSALVPLGETDTPTPTEAPPMDTPVPTDTPTPMDTPVPTDTPTPTDTPVPSTPAPAPTDTPGPGPTNTPVPTDTPGPTDTPTPVPAIPVTGADNSLTTIPLAMVAAGLLLAAGGITLLWRLLADRNSAA
ncbi:MAG: hypothetical protein ACUVWR_10170 [Anaerolineae bacterium]